VTRSARARPHTAPKDIIDLAFLVRLGRLANRLTKQPMRLEGGPDSQVISHRLSSRNIHVPPLRLRPKHTLELLPSHETGARIITESARTPSLVWKTIDRKFHHLRQLQLPLRLHRSLTPLP
jgi:hypothetical protein